MPLVFSRQEPSSKHWKVPNCWEWGPDRLFCFLQIAHGCQRMNLEDGGLTVVVGVSRAHFLLTKANTISSLNPLYLACPVNPAQPFFSITSPKAVRATALMSLLPCCFAHTQSTVLKVTLGLALFLTVLPNWKS